MDLSFAEFGAIFAMQGFNGLSVFCVLLLMALGLAIIFGQMGVINMAHGEFLTIGAYTTFFISTLTESFFPQLLPYYFLIAIIAAFLTAGIIGYMVERLMISRLYQRPLDTLLATWGLSLIMQQLFRSIFGPKEVSPTLPDWLMGSYPGGRYPLCHCICLLSDLPFTLGFTASCNQPEPLYEWCCRDQY